MIRKEVELNVTTGNSEDNLQYLNKQTDKLNDNLKDTQKQANKTKGVFGGLGKAFKGLGNLVKTGFGLGIGIQLFETFTEILKSNQVIVDITSTAFEALSIAVGDLVNFVMNNAQPVIDAFKAMFENPVETIKSFANSIKDNLIERFNSFIETLGFVGKAVSALFSGDFALAGELAKKAGKELVDVATGVDNSYEKIGDTFTKVKDAVVDYTIETVKQAKANVELKKSADLVSVVNQGLIEEYDTLTEQQRQLRDDTNLSFEDRRKASEELARLLEEQAKLQRENAQNAVTAAEAELAKDRNNVEAKKALIEANNELKAVEAAITGFRSEQQAQQRALDQEERDSIKATSEAELEAYATRERARIETIDNENEKLLAQKELEDFIFNEKKKRLEDELETVAAGSAREAELNNELTQLKADNEARLTVFTKTEADKREKIADEERKAKVDAQIEALAAIGNALAAFGEENKALAKAAVIINAAVAAIGIWRGTADLGPLGIITRVAQTVALAASTATALRNIDNADSGSAASFSNGSAGTRPNVGGLNANNNGTGSNGFNTNLANTLNNIDNNTSNPTRAYVVSTDITSQQQLDRRVRKDSTL